MIRKLLTLALLFALAVGTAQAQTGTANNKLGFAYANDYGKWAFQSAASVATGAQTVTIRFDAFATTPDGVTFYPLATNAPLLFDSEGANPETLTPSAVTCTQNSLQGTCTVTVTFVNAHTGNFSVKSGTYGICEAKNAIANTPGVTGGTIVVANGFGGTSSTITSTAACAAANFNLLDVRKGVFQFYAPSGTAFVASTSVFNTATAADATVVSAIGAPYFYTGGFVQTLNGGFATVADGANTAGAKIDLLKTRVASTGTAATTTVVTGDDLALVNAWGADGTNYINSAAIEFKSTGTIATTRVPSQIILKTGTDAAPTVLTAALTLGADQSATVGGNLYAATYRNSATAPDATITAQAVAPSSFTSTVGGTNAQEAAAQTGANTAGVQNFYFKTRAAGAASAATTVIVTGDTIAQHRYFGADGTNYIEGARIEVNSAGTIAATRIPTNMKFYTGTDAAPTVLTQALLLDQSQNATFAGKVFSANIQNLTTALDATVTAQAPAPSLANVTAPATNANAAFVSGVASAVGAQIVGFKTRATTAGGPATTVVVTSDDELAVRAFGADGANYIESASMTFTATGTIASTRVPGKITFKTGTDAAPTVLTAALVIDKDQSTTPVGGLGAATSTSGTAGFSTTWADTGSPAAGTTGTNTTGVANQLWYTQIFVPYNITVTNIGILSGGTATTDKIAMGIWKTDGQTLIRATAATVGAGTVLSGANTWQKLALTSTVVLAGPARYIVGVVTSGATAGDIQTYPLASGPVCAVQTSMGTLNTAFSPVTTSTAASCPYLFLD